MTIKMSRNGNMLLVRLEGRLDTTTAPELEEKLLSSLEGISELKLDMEKLEYISSAGLRTLIAARKTMDKPAAMTVIRPCDVVMEVFEVTGFADILNFEE